MPHLQIRAGERMVMELRPSWLKFVHHYVIAIAAVVFFGFFGQLVPGLSLAAVILALPPIHRFSRLYTITTCRVVERKGLIARHVAEADLGDIILLNVHQGIWERLFSLGKIDMMSASDGGPDVVFDGINAPFDVKEVIANLRAQRARRW